MTIEDQIEAIKRDLNGSDNMRTTTDELKSILSTLESVRDSLNTQRVGNDIAIEDQIDVVKKQEQSFFKYASNMYDASIIDSSISDNELDQNQFDSECLKAAITTLESVRDNKLIDVKEIINKLKEQRILSKGSYSDRSAIWNSAIEKSIEVIQQKERPQYETIYQYKEPGRYDWIKCSDYFYNKYKLQYEVRQISRLIKSENK